MQDGVIRLIAGTGKRTDKTSFYDCVDKSMSGEIVPMSKFKGDVLLVVNVASKWGLTKKNYTELPKLVDQYGSRGFKVLAFPCNQFGGQEPGTHDEIIEFVKKFDPNMTDKLTFFEKANVNGPEAREVFSFLKYALPNESGAVEISWNFEKFLVDRNGTPVKRFSPQAAIDTVAIEKLL